MWPVFLFFLFLHTLLLEGFSSYSAITVHNFFYNSVPLSLVPMGVFVLEMNLAVLNHKN